MDQRDRRQSGFTAHDLQWAMETSYPMCSSREEPETLDDVELRQYERELVENPSIGKVFEGGQLHRRHRRK